MTAPIASTSAPPPRANPAGESRGEVDGSAPFERQLQAASQRMVTHAPGQQVPGAAPAQSGSEVAGLAQAAAAVPPQDMPAALFALPAAATAALVAELTGAEPAAEPAVAPDEVDEQAASALAGAMLALLGPAVAGVLRPAAAGVSADASADSLQPFAGMPAMKASELAMSAQLLGGDAAKLLQDTSTASDGSAQPIALPAGPAPAAPVATHQLQVPTPVGNQAFARDLGQQVMWLGGQDIKQARIRLHPEELGSLDVHVSVQHGRVDVVFSAQHPGAVAAVQQSLPQLDQMLAQHGLSLGHTEVGQQDRGDQQGSGDRSRPGAMEDTGESQGVSPLASPGMVGLVDAFA